VAPQQQADKRLGFLYGAFAYVLWGGLPLFFLLLSAAGAVEIVALRILFSLVFCAFLLTVTRSWARLAKVVAVRRTVWIMGLAGLFIFINWQTYVLAALSGRVVEASLGYFINPIVTVFLGVFLLKEKLRPLQWTAVGISMGAVVVLAFGYGALPWISLVLAFSFGFYGLIKKQVGNNVDALTGLTLETMWLVPIAVLQLVGVAVFSSISFGTVSPWLTIGLLSAGVVTAVPLLLFAAAARRLPLTSIGLLQYIAPIMQFCVGVFVLGEDMPPERWLGFGMVWLALVLLTIDMLISGGASRRASRRLR
jgi:chloramphenicol-sensitive protein RarD